MYHGKPCWFELTTAPGQLAAAGAFYNRVLGWDIADSGMEGFTYHLASHDEHPVAGLMETSPVCAEAPPNWMIYLDVDDVDATVRRVAELGGKVLRSPADIPGTGRFAVAADPQGAVFGLLQPSPMDPQPPADAGAWNQNRESHGNWIELMTTDPTAGLDFYAAIMGWDRGDSLDMGAAGTYQLFRWQGAEIGGMMGLGNAPQPCWLPYFGVNGVNAAMARITESGGQVLYGPAEVPGGAVIIAVRDPQGAHFALVGPAEHSA
ncbi:MULTISPECIES: VOC family protein [unclassified Paracoccus (in: a-proteobacteria)]|uniref:VOC family protein n=1 Tax=unclassified Paracoccus (in: a-proteobacteria) TaxID=2688777 RepID=UPI0012B19948|nr:MULTISPECIES: VOC family protein [unclassified Paracoccus (in: a-proteobacteria)]UXU75608.1 VOC family protein [Paracoccus sp. SMMA_5]UXU81512.1 VOC family protein [Paracoccus sp. SMMA_5_TC]